MQASILRSFHLTASLNYYCSDRFDLHTRSPSIFSPLPPPLHTTGHDGEEGEIHQIFRHYWPPSFSYQSSLLNGIFLYDCWIPVHRLKRRAVLQYHSAHTQGCQPFGTKKCPIFDEKCPKWGFYFWKNARYTKIAHFFHVLLKENASCLKKCQFFRKRH